MGDYSKVIDTSLLKELCIYINACIILIVAKFYLEIMSAMRLFFQRYKGESV